MTFLKSKFEYVILAIFAAVAAYFASGAVLFSSSPTDRFPVWLFTILLVLLISSFSFLIFYLVKKKGYVANKKMVMFFIILLIYEIIIISTYKNNQTYSVKAFESGDIIYFSKSYSPYDYTYNIARFLSVILLAFTIIDIVPKICSKNELYLICCILLGVAFVSIIASLVLDSKNLVTMVQNSFEDMHAYAFKSFYPSKNTFGLVLLCSTLALFILHSGTNRSLYLYPLILVFIFLVLTQSKIIIATNVLVLLGYFGFRFCCTYKKHKKENIIALSITCAVILLGILLFLVVPPLKDILNKIYTHLFQSFKGVDTIEARKIIWDNSFDLISNHHNLFTGAGFGFFNDVLRSYNNADLNYQIITDGASVAHNMYIELIGWGGIILLLFWVMLFAYIIYVLAKNFKHNISFSAIGVISIVAVIFITIFESGPIIFSTDGQYIFLTALIYFPIAMKENQIAS